ARRRAPHRGRRGSRTRPVSNGRERVCPATPPRRSLLLCTMTLRPLCCSLLLAACASPPPAPPPPTPLAPHLLYRYGPALAGPLAPQLQPDAAPRGAAADASASATGMHWHIEVRRVAGGAGSPLAAFADTVVCPAPAAQFAAFPRRLATVRVAPASAD